MAFMSDSCVERSSVGIEMRLQFFIIFCAILWESQVTAQNYCDPSLCSTGRHVACNNPNRFQGCNGVEEPIPFRRWLILELHNKLRDRIAGGQMPGFPSAVRMGTMTWDEELERVASKNLFQCRLQHDQCRNTPRYRFSGQNLFIVASNTANLDQVITQAINEWSNESRNAVRRDMERYQNTGARRIARFAVMVRESNVRIGCAIARWSTPRPATYFVCNYATTTIIGQPIYRFGTTASQCRQRPEGLYRNLCAHGEIYDHTRP